MDDGYKTPIWDDAQITVPRRLLQEVELALSNSRGLIQRLESHGDDGKEGCSFGLDARDRRALSWGREALANVREALTQNE